MQTRDRPSRKNYVKGVRKKGEKRVEPMSYKMENGSFIFHSRTAEEEYCTEKTKHNSTKDNLGGQK